MKVEAKKSTGVWRDSKVKKEKRIKKWDEKAPKKI